MGDGTDPVSVSLTLDGTNSPTSVTGSTAAQTWVWANDDTGTIGSYSSISVAISGSNTGITWELSLNGSTGWGSSINLSTMDVSSTFQAVRIYARASALNDGTVATAHYTTADIVISATENPDA
jgi:hypothetical protein